MEKTVKEKIQDLRSLIQWKLDVIGESNALYIPKCIYIPSGKLQRYVTFWENELSTGKDIYISKASRDYKSEDPNNNLYKWVYNPFYKDEYEKIVFHTGDIRYLITFNELHDVKIEPVNIVSNVLNQKEIVNDINIKEDAIKAMIDDEVVKDTSEYILNKKIQVLSVRDFIAILHLKPTSNDEVLNDYIKVINNTK